MDPRRAIPVLVVFLLVVLSVGLVIAHRPDGRADAMPTLGTLPDVSAPVEDVPEGVERVAICVDVMDVELPRNRLAVAVRTAIKEIGWPTQSIERFRYPDISEGCPRAAAHDDRNRLIDSKTNRITVHGGRAEQGALDLHVYLISDAQFRDWFGDQPYARSIEAFGCAGDQCWSATIGLYAPSSMPPDDLVFALADVLGFR